MSPRKITFRFKHRRRKKDKNKNCKRKINGFPNILFWHIAISCLTILTKRKYAKNCVLKDRKNIHEKMSINVYLKIMILFKE